ncbi:MAG: hypothetical protein M3009_03350 [Bombella apis]|uniref:hypothetical protein n=1 Tax=Bombella apis TaxID=1785988 RepID=UPI0023F135EC|nr:hypothetical protein [Bombella apis]MCT6819495.1 hypothetical protein [Bombella apis]
MEKILRSLARWVWEIQGEAYSGRYKNTGLVIHEETITEMLLLRCVRVARGRQPGGGKRGRIPPFVAFDVKMFSKAEESRNGADWEWLFKFGDCEFGFRVQAKRLYEGSGYDGFGRNNKQNDDLIAQAQASGLIPVYVFYNHGFGRDSYLFGGGSFIGGYSRRRSDWGCSVAHAECVRDVYANNKGRKGRVDDIFPYMLPWHELFGLALIMAAWMMPRLRKYANFYLKEFIYSTNQEMYYCNLIQSLCDAEDDVLRSCSGYVWKNYDRYFRDQCPLEWILKNYGPDGGDAYEKPDGRNAREKHVKFFKKYIESFYKRDPSSDKGSENKFDIDAILAQIDDKEKMSDYVKKRNLGGVAVFTLSELEVSRRDDPAERHSSKARR